MKTNSAPNAFVRATDLASKKLLYLCIPSYLFGIFSFWVGLDNHWINLVAAIPTLLAGAMLLVRLCFGKWMRSFDQMGFQSNRRAIWYLGFTYRGFHWLPVSLGLIGVVLLFVVFDKKSLSFLPVFGGFWLANIVAQWTRRVPSDSNDPSS